LTEDLNKIAADNLAQEGERLDGRDKNLVDLQYDSNPGEISKNSEHNKFEMENSKNNASKDNINNKSFDVDGYDQEGKDKDGRDKNGFDKDGIDKNGNDKDGHHIKDIVKDEELSPYSRNKI